MYIARGSCAGSASRSRRRSSWRRRARGRRVDRAHHRAPHHAELHRPDHGEHDAGDRGRGRSRKSTLSFLGFGVQPPAHLVGSMLSKDAEALHDESRQVLSDLLPGLMILILTVLCRELPRRRSARRLRPAVEALTDRQRRPRPRHRGTGNRCIRPRGCPLGSEAVRRVQDRRRHRARGRRRDASTCLANETLGIVGESGSGQVGHVAGDPGTAAEDREDHRRGDLRRREPGRASRKGAATRIAAIASR